MPPFKYLFLLLICLITLISCSPQPSSSVTVSPLGGLTKNGVDVQLNLEQNQDGQTVIAATYRPLEPLFHVYSKDLPPTGIDGIGRPTRLEIVSGPLEAIGELQADVPPLQKQFAGFDTPFPIYPDGPVTLRLPVNLHEVTPTDNIAEFSVSYVACSSKGVCLLPVFSQSISVTLPSADD